MCVSVKGIGCGVCPLQFNRLLIDVGRCRGLVAGGSQRVVAGMGAAKGQAAECDGLALSSVFVGERSCGCNCQVVACHYAGEGGGSGDECRCGVAVIVLSAGGDAANSDRLRIDRHGEGRTGGVITAAGGLVGGDGYRRGAGTDDVELSVRADGNHTGIA